VCVYVERIEEDTKLRE